MKRILIAEGNSDEAARLQQALELQGHRTALLEDGGQFLGFCQQHQPDLVIVDVDLPVVNGWAAVHGLRTEESTAAIPAIGLSAHSSPVEAQQAQSIGFNQLLAKPIEMESFLVSVEEVLSTGVVGIRPGGAPEPAPAPMAAVASADRGTVAAPMDSPVSTPQLGDDEDCSFERVSQVSQSIDQLIDGLRPHTTALGADGPELFGYIENGQRQIAEKLGALAKEGPEVTENALYDKDLRHDFRNMIGSVTGFAELILMESGIEQKLASALTLIRQHSSEFVRLLDAQKAAAASV